MFKLTGKEHKGKRTVTCAYMVGTNLYLEAEVHSLLNTILNEITSYTCILTDYENSHAIHPPSLLHSSAY